MKPQDSKTKESVGRISIHKTNSKTSSFKSISQIKPRNKSKFVEKQLDGSSKSTETGGDEPRGQRQDALDNNTSNQREKNTASGGQHHSDGKIAKGYTSSLFRANPEVPVFEHKEVVPITEAVFSSEHVDDMPIHEYAVSVVIQREK